MKKLIIVCEDRLRKYGDFLAQLISSQDDMDENTVGIKDGSLAAQVWSEKEYLANQAQISSEQYILFIGNSKNLKDKHKFLMEQFSKYGMKYAWRGKQAALFVEDSLSIAEYNDFFNFTQEYQPDVVRLLGTKGEQASVAEEEKSSAEAETMTPGICYENEENDRKKLVPVKLIKNTVVDVAHNGEMAFKKLGQNINKSFNNKKIEEQQYSCLTLLFYLNGLSFFLGLSEG